MSDSVIGHGQWLTDGLESQCTVTNCQTLTVLIVFSEICLLFAKLMY